MGLKQTLQVLNNMEAAGVIGRYCVVGAVAAMNYVEVSSTDDLDILVSFEEARGPGGLITLSPILKYLGGLGYTDFRADGVVIEGWPVQFLPIATSLDAEMLDTATNVVFDDGEPTVTCRVAAPALMVAKALQVGRPKDRFRALQFLESRMVAEDELCSVVERHGLFDALAALCASAGLPNPCVIDSNL